MIEIPVQDPSTVPYVDLRLTGSTNLATGSWTMDLAPAANQEGVPGNRCRWVPLGNPGNAFFRLHVTPK